MENYLWLRLKGIDDGKKATCERRQNIRGTNMLGLCWSWDKWGPT